MAGIEAVHIGDDERKTFFFGWNVVRNISIIFDFEELLSITDKEFLAVKRWFLANGRYLEAIALAKTYGPLSEHNTPHFEDRYVESIYYTLLRIKDTVDCPVIKSMVTELIQQGQAQQENRTIAADTKENRVKGGSGWVYAIASKEDRSLVKIGMTRRTPDERLNQLRPKLPFETELICTIPSDDVIGLERYIHERFADKRVNGEWFRLDYEDVTWLGLLFDGKWGEKGKC